MTSDCLFCNIVAGNVPADIVHETDATLAFRDINPQAPAHILIIPRQHIATINELGDDGREAVGSLFTAARDIAAAEGIADDGYRVVMNCNQAAGQTVFHLHLHLLGGRTLSWPPG
ncbi:MAG: histidine triad nucleotide-binding protein [Pseudomonadota bacterium]